ncbi:MAG TPA: extracellular solute-binding protein, partial [Anaerolineae bacterium]|nr:extracellular solute-binding protein [Anaerolineae bacterium]
MNRRLFALVSLVMALSMVLTACAQPAPAPAATQPPQIIKETVVIKETVAAPEPTALPDRVQIYWYIGLGAGAQKDDIPKEKAFCDKFNASQHEIQLIPVVVDNNYARDNLKAQIAAGNAPDIVGPVGKKGRGFFPGAFVDLMPLINEFKYDLSDVDQKFLDFYKDEGKVVGLPFAIFPSFTYYNKALFDEAKLPYPPEKYGEKYDGREWNMDTVRDLAMKLTVDANGNDATDPAFDPKNIVQYGLEIQWTDARGYATAFGGGALVDDKGNAQVPEHWKAAWEWMYKGMWTDHCIPTQAAVDSDLMGGNPFGSGVVGMAFCHLWFAPCCIPKEKVKEWGIAAMPSYNGTVTAKL